MSTQRLRTTSVVALVALVASSIPVAVMLKWPDVVLRMGMSEKLWYATYLMLGFGITLCLFSFFRNAAAQYRGEALGGALELGGPPAMVVIFVLLAFSVPSKPNSKFDLTVYLQLPEGASTALFSGVKVRADLAANPRIEDVDAKGVARFVGIPFDLEGKTVPVSLLDAPQYELTTGSSATIRLSSEAIYLKLRWKNWQLEGTVKDDQGQPIRGAKVYIAGQNLLSDSNGHFSLTLSKQLSGSRLQMDVSHDGYNTWSNLIGSGSESATIQLVRTP